MSTRFGSFSLRLLPLGAAAILLAAPVTAQDPEAQPEDGRCVCMGDLGSIPDLRAFTTARRAMLGIVLGEPIEVAGRMGVRLEQVRDGSPAGRAGLRGGDVVVALDGRDLGDDPAATLLDIMREVEPGDTVTATFVRGDEERTAPIVAGPSSLFTFTDGERFRMRVPGARGSAMIATPRPPHGELREMVREMRRPAMLYRHLVGGGLELTAVNPGLGSYFGIDRGVLVTAIESDSDLNLQAGDVILAIGGREVREPAHARAMIASYREDEEITFRIMREQRTLEIAGRP